jgi:TfoX/Sxy family transcriptional regulator of competence genes
LKTRAPVWRTPDELLQWRHPALKLGKAQNRF